MTLGVSIGVALTEFHETLDDTLRGVDAALYQAKLGGRGQHGLWRPDLAPTMTASHREHDSQPRG